jgi:hypothetical protein
MIDTISIFGIAFMVLYVAYMLNSDKPLFYPYFWRTMNYCLIYGLPFTMFICLIPATTNTLQLSVLLSLIVFFGEFLVFNLLIANLDYIKFKEYINSRVFILILSYSVAVMLLTVGIIKLIKK